MQTATPIFSKISLFFSRFVSDVQSRNFETYGFWLFLGGVIAALVAINPSSGISAPLLKLSLSAFAFGLSALCLLLSRASNRAAASPKTMPRPVLVALLLLPAAYLLSWIFSVDHSLALLGEGNEVDSIVFLGVSYAGLLLGSLYIRSFERGRFFARGIGGAILLSAGIVYLNLLFGTALLPADIFTTSTANLVGSWMDFGLITVLGALLLVSYIEFTPLSRTRKEWLTAVYAALLLLIAAVDSVLVSVFLVVGAAALGWFKKGIERSSSSTSSEKPWWIIAALVCGAVLSLWGTGIAGRLPSALRVTSIEVRPAFLSTYEVTRSVFNSSPARAVVGSGPNTFIQDWIHYKPVVVNNTQFWNVDFSVGWSTVLTSLTSAGILGLIGWMSLLVLGLKVFVRGKKATLAAPERERSVLFAYTLAPLFLLAVAAVYTPSQGVLILGFAILGAALGLWFYTERTPEPTALPSKRNAMVPLVVLALGAALICVLAFFPVRRLISAAYAAGAAAKLTQNDIQGAAQLGAQSQAIERYGGNLRLGVAIDFARLKDLLSEKNASADADKLKQAFQSLLLETVGQGQYASQLNPSDYRPYLALAEVYAYLASFGIEGAYDQAKLSLQGAMERNPTSPALPLYLARLEAGQDLAGNADAIDALIAESLQLKNNYTDAFLLTEQIAVARNDLDAATLGAESAAQSSPSEAPLWFQLGLFYYAGNRISDAVSAFENAVQLQPNYANAKYFLGLSYEKNGRHDDAITQFEDVRRSNPDNEEVKLILSNLHTGKDAFAGVKTPLNFNPLQRPSAPINE